MHFQRENDLAAAYVTPWSPTVDEAELAGWVPQSFSYPSAKAPQPAPLG